jgi:UDP-2,4-diacetamido-2,4,6-trideoxy-beta-L-altropyranose hydrolase
MGAAQPDGSQAREVNLIFRVEAGKQIGLGHLQRCLGLAAAPVFAGARVRFVMAGAPDAHTRVAAAGFESLTVAPGASDLDLVLDCAGDASPAVVVVDWREADQEYLWRLRRSGAVVVSLDDLGGMPFPSHVVVNSNSFAAELSYASASGDTEFLIGPSYLILRPEFWDVPAPEPRDDVGTVLVTFGGGDRLGLTVPIVRLIAEAPEFSRAKIVVLAGPFMAGAADLSALQSGAGRIDVRRAPPQVVDVMRDADVAVSAGGQTLYELARVGCPTVGIEVSTDQTDQLRTLEARGVIRAVRGRSSSDLQAVSAALRELAGDAAARRQLSSAGRCLVDGRGAQRVGEAILARVA